MMTHRGEHYGACEEQRPNNHGRNYLERDGRFPEVTQYYPLHNDSYSSFAIYRKIQKGFLGIEREEKQPFKTIVTRVVFLHSLPRTVILPESCLNPGVDSWQMWKPRLPGAGLC